MKIISDMTNTVTLSPAHLVNGVLLGKHVTAADCSRRGRIIIFG